MFTCNVDLLADWAENNDRSKLKWFEEPSSRDVARIPEEVIDESPLNGSYVVKYGNGQNRRESRIHLEAMRRSQDFTAPIVCADEDLEWIVMKEMNQDVDNTASAGYTPWDWFPKDAEVGRDCDEKIRAYDFGKYELKDDDWYVPDDPTNWNEVDFCKTDNDTGYYQFPQIPELEESLYGD